MGRQKLAVESTISNIKGLDYVILRPAIVYGPGDRAGLSESTVFSHFIYSVRSKCLYINIFLGNSRLLSNLKNRVKKWKWNQP